MDKKIILAINTGSTSTKVALFSDSEAVFCETIRHAAADIEEFGGVLEQYAYREKAVLAALAEHNADLNALDAVVGRGGLLRPIAGGAYEINDLMLNHLKSGEQGVHASNLACLLAHDIAEKCDVPCYTVDPVVVDEMEDIARITGCHEIQRYCVWHALNQKAVARNHAKRLGKRYEEINVVVAHIGGGCSVGAHRKGRVVDVTNALSGEGPFTGERAGKLPVEAAVKLFASGRYGDAKAFLHTLNNQMGLLSLVGTNDGREVEKKIADGDAQAQLAYRAMAYQIAKEIGAAAVVLEGRVDAVILTGGFAYDEKLMGWIADAVSFLAPVVVVPGEDEMAALAQGVLRVLRGEEKSKVYLG